LVAARKEKREGRDSEVKKGGDMDRGKVEAKKRENCENCESGGNRLFHECPSVAAQKNWSCWPNLVDSFQ
jgi:hypothetical protein